MRRKEKMGSMLRAFSKLQAPRKLKDDCKSLAEDLGKKLAEGNKNIPSAIVKVEELSAELQEVEKTLNEHFETYNKVTHTLGPSVSHVMFSLIKQCLTAKMTALEEINRS
ncbi:uncharacterized protein LOC143521170 [Brachyhypopomus gauderio]|uniref:uncharacterized protein LOC143521170 n=1 Tax=Brachyhypopomus gauderio TaxID=698409 RepID=UPI00404228F3